MGDIGLAVRSLLKSKVFTAVAIVTLAIGIGASTAIFAIFNGVALRPLPFPHPDRLVDVEEWSATELCAHCAVGVSALTLGDLKGRATAVQSIAAYVETPVNIAGADLPERVGGALISGNFFSVLGVRPMAGRLTDPGDDRHGAAPVVVIGERLLASRYAGDTSIVGRSIRINGIPHTVIGVAPRTAVLPELAQVWTPLNQSYHVVDRAARELGVIARLRDDVDVRTADLEFKTIASSISKAHPETQRGWTVRVRPLRSVVAGDEATVVGIMLGAVIVLLLIVCANLASLMLARGEARRKDIAVRLALGARRSSIVRYLMSEAICLAVVGGIFGAIGASWAVDLALAGLETTMPSWLDTSLDPRVFAFTCTASLLAAVAFGLVPAFFSSRLDMHSGIKAGAAAHTPGGGSRLRGGLVVIQMALSLILLAAAGVLAVTVQRVSAREVGVADHDALQAHVDILGSRSLSETNIVVTSLVDRLSAIPGVRAVAAYATGFVAGFGTHDQSIQAEGVAQLPGGASPRFFFSVTPSYFAVEGLRLVRGRTFTAADGGGSPVVVLSNDMSRRIWGGADPIGRRIKLGEADSMPWRTVVGVVSDRGSAAAGTVSNYAYVPFAQAPQAGVTLLISAVGEPAALINPVREVARATDPDLPLLELMTVDEAQARTYWPYRADALLMTAVGAVALILAAVGLYGVIALAAERRRREVGVRIALGARRRDVVRLITRQGVGLVLIGLAFGLAGAVAMLPAMKSMLFGASSLDPFVFSAAALLLVVVSFIASYLPARRASRVDPMAALRDD